ncbi:MAG: hypothetical protein OSA98_25685 [Rubripirellula sp.]|nr:hypothetical protein [Rubripirellula sp.]
MYSQGGLRKEQFRRDHHPRCFSIWMAGERKTHLSDSLPRRSQIA